MLWHVLAAHPAPQTVLVLLPLVEGQRVCVARTQVDDAGGFLPVISQKLRDQRRTVLDEYRRGYLEVLGLPASGEVGDERVELAALGGLSGAERLGGLFAAIKVLHFL